MGFAILARGMVTDGARMEYIDSELVKRRSAQANSSAISASDTFVKTGSNIEGNRPEKVTQKENGKDVQRQPAAMGKLMEIDLGDEARNRNVELTEKARRKLEGDEDIEDNVVKKPVKVRLGPDGKPWRSKKKRRGSDDVKRDRLVEDILRENRRKLFIQYMCKCYIANFQQWKFTMSHRQNRTLMMTRRRMIGLRRNLEGSLWIRKSRRRNQFLDRLRAAIQQRERRKKS